MHRGRPRGCAQQQQVHSAKSTDALHWLRTARRRLQRRAQHRSRVGRRCTMASCRLSGASSPPISWTANCLAELKKPEWITELTRCTHTDTFKQQYQKVKKLGSGTFSKVYRVEKKDRLPTESPSIFVAKHFVAKQPEDCNRFATELFIHRLAQSHRNIVTLFEAFATPGSGNLPVLEFACVFELGMHSLQQHLEHLCVVSDGDMCRWMSGVLWQISHTHTPRPRGMSKSFAAVRFLRTDVCSMTSPPAPPLGEQSASHDSVVQKARPS